MNVIVYQCKTPGCQALIKVGEMGEDTLRTIYIPHSVGVPDPLEITCPDCGRAYDYYFSEHQIRRLVHEEAP
jgi:hypothetical protein